jgi:hypothetical protein
LIRWVLNFTFVVSSVRDAGNNDGDGGSGHSASDDIDVGAEVDDISATRRGVGNGDGDTFGKSAMLAASGTIEELGWGLPLVVLPRTPQPQPLVRAIRIEY